MKVTKKQKGTEKHFDISTFKVKEEPTYEVVLEDSKFKRLLTSIPFQVSLIFPSLIMFFLLLEPTKPYLIGLSMTFGLCISRTLWEINNIFLIFKIKNEKDT